jgi:CheY-like chemotaxis protein
MARERHAAREVRNAHGGDHGWPDEQAEAVPQGNDTIDWASGDRRLLRVLVADDNRDMADSLCMLMKMWGHESWPAYDGATALELASAHQPDVLMVDLAMPTLDGYQLARQLRQHPVLKGALLIALTGYTDEAHRRLSEEAGFDHYLIKPAEPQRVEALLLLERNRLPESPEVAPERPRQRPFRAAQPEGGVEGSLLFSLTRFQLPRQVSPE